MREQSTLGFAPAWRLAIGILTTLVLSGTFALAQSNLPERSASYAVGPSSGSGLSGTLVISDFGEELSVVVLALEGTSPGDAHPSHFHVGDCGSGGGVDVPLAVVDGGSGLGVSVVRMAYDDLLAQDYHVNAHRSAADMGTIVACGEVGAGAQQGVAQADGASAAQAAATADPLPGNEAGNEAGNGDAGAVTEAEAQMSLETQSYQLFALQGNSVTGTLNVTQEVDGGSRFVVTLSNINPGEQYLPVLFEGDCGPDRERVTGLPPVGSIANEPFVSISSAEMSYDEVADGDYFLYIYQGDEESNPLACGEVGAGANR
ncbi:MAG: hypothetical protein WD273_06590 [Trueperaceae bacterium]